jgi:hypothetical protein
MTSSRIVVAAPPWSIRTARRADLDSASAARFPWLIQVLSTPARFANIGGE